MRGTLIGSDYMYDNGQLKTLEVNTNIGIHKGISSYLHWDRLFTMLSGSGVTEFVFIFNEDYLQFPLNPEDGQDANNTEFVQTIKNYCTNYSMSYDERLVPPGQVTVPFVEDGPTKFILRQSYDNTAIIDSTYAADNFEFYSLMKSSSYCPDVYYSSSIDELYDDKLTTLDTSSRATTINHQRYPIKREDFPRMYKFPNLEAQTSMKSAIDEDTYLVKYIDDNENIKNNRVNVIRGLDIIYGDNLDVINLGGYWVSSLMEIDEYPTEFSGSDYALSKRTKTQFTTKPSTKTLRYHTEGHEQILMADGTTKGTNDIEVGDVITSYSSSFISGSENTFLDAYNTWDQLAISSSFTTSSLISKDSINLNNLLVQMTLDDGMVITDPPRGSYLIEQSGSNIDYFLSTNLLIPGDKLIFVNSSSGALNKREIVSLGQVWVTSSTPVTNYDFEPSNYFLTEVTASGEWLINHNYCYYCSYSWAPCGSYWCDSSCPPCFGPPPGEFK